MAFSKTYFRAVSLMARITGRWAQHERARAQEAAYLAGAQQRLEESGRLSAEWRQKNPAGQPRRIEQAATVMPPREANSSQKGIGALPTAGN